MSIINHPTLAGDMGILNVLVTGFQPFGQHENNISEDTVLRLKDTYKLEDPWASKRNTSSLVQVSIEKKILTVDFEGSKYCADKINQGQQYDAIIHVGLAENSEMVRIEKIGKDILDFRIPDNSGRQVYGKTISGNGDLESSCELKRWDVSSWDIPTRISEDAGEFLCNEVYHRTLDSISKKGLQNEFGKDIPCLFIHLPNYANITIEHCCQSILNTLSHMLHVPVIDVAAGILVENGKFLAARRSPLEAFAGFWEFPGGKLESEENTQQAVVREYEEELGIKVHYCGDVGTWWNDFGHLQVRLLVVWVIQTCNDEIKLTVHDDMIWCNPESLPDVEWLGPDKEIAEYVCSEINSINFESK